MPTAPSSSDKSRQTSGGKSSFFTRKIHKGRQQQDAHDSNPAPSSLPEALSAGAASIGSYSSRHSKHGSIHSMEEQDQETVGLPYDVVHPENRTPVPVEYLPKTNDHRPERRDQQYSGKQALNDGKQALHDLHQSVHQSVWNLHSAFKEGGTPLAPSKQFPATSQHANNSSLNDNRGHSSYATDSSANSRLSVDQASIMSHGSSNRNSIGHDTLRPNSHSSSYSGFNTPRVQQMFSPSPSVVYSPPPPLPNGQDGQFTRPKDDRVVDKMFYDLMIKRGWQNLPEQAKRQMLAYPASKKWTLVHQDRLTQWQGDQKRRQHAKQTFLTPGTSLVDKADEEGSPEWYVKRVLDDKITAKELQSLSVSLRTQPISWVKSFVEAQGQVALTSVLLKINRRQASGPISPTSNSGDKDLDREYDIAKCLKALMNNKYGADDALAHQQVIVSLASSLISPRLTTRKMISEILTFLCHWGDGQGHKKVLQAMDHVKNIQGETGRFDAWIRIVEVTIDGRGKMGSLVGASEEFRSGGIGMENLLMEYAVATMLLINMLVDAPQEDLHLRCHIRAQFTSCGIKRVLNKMEGFQYEVIDKQIERYRENEAIDYEDLLQREGTSMKDGIEGEVHDMNDPLQITNAIISKFRGSRTQDYFTSAMQHMLLIRENSGEDGVRMFQLVDAMLSYVAMDRRLPDLDLKQSLNFTVQSLLDKLHTDAEARHAFMESVEARQIAEAAIAERDEVKAQLELGADGLVKKLQKQIDEQTAIINLQHRQAEALKADLAEAQRLRNAELQRNELETRELYLMLRDAQDVAAAKSRAGNAKVERDPTQMNGILDREKLMERLERQLERTKTQFILEGKLWQEYSPSDRLRELRERMEGTPDYDFEEETKKNLSSGTLGVVRKRSKLSGASDAGDDEESQEEVSEIVEEVQDEEGTIIEKPRIVKIGRRPRIKPEQVAVLNELNQRNQRAQIAEEPGEGTGVEARVEAPTTAGPVASSGAAVAADTAGGEIQVVPEGMKLIPATDGMKLVPAIEGMKLVSAADQAPTAPGEPIPVSLVPGATAPVPVPPPAPPLPGTSGAPPPPIFFNKK